MIENDDAELKTVVAKLVLGSPAVEAVGGNVGIVEEEDDVEVKVVEEISPVNGAFTQNVWTGEPLMVSVMRELCNASSVEVFDAVLVGGFLSCEVSAVLAPMVTTGPSSGQPLSGRQGSTEQHPEYPLSQLYHCLPDPEGHLVNILSILIESDHGVGMGLC